MRSCRLSELIRGLQNLEAPFGKVLILFVRSRHCGELNRGSQNLEKFQKDLILFVRDSCLGADSRFAGPRISLRGRTACHFLHRAKSNQKARARTCKKLPVASFCASETAETGRIANGREQGDHVSRRQSGKGFNFVCAKLWFCALIQGLENLELPERETDCYFLRRAKSNQKARGTPSCDLDSKLCRRRFQQSFPTARAETGFSHKTAAKRL